jgi:hypothetical protein
MTLRALFFGSLFLVLAACSHESLNPSKPERAEQLHPGEIAKQLDASPPSVQIEIDKTAAPKQELISRGSTP